MAATGHNCHSDRREESSETAKFVEVKLSLRSRNECPYSWTRFLAGTRNDKGTAWRGMTGPAVIFSPFGESSELARLIEPGDDLALLGDLPQDVRQDAAVVVVIDLYRRVDASGHREALDRTVRCLGPHA